MISYETFLKGKQKTLQPTGFECEPENNNLFDFQRTITKWALKKGRSGLFLDTGLGKTICELVYSEEVYKKTNKNILIVAPLAVSKQTAREADKFGIEVNLCRTQKDVKKGINITNYEMLKHFDVSSFIGGVLDESSILKSYTGTIKQELIKQFRNTPYKISCTATPSPNNTMEILNQAEFLGVMKSNEALAIWFINDTSRSGNYVLKGHAVKPFWEWVSTWAVCINKPSDIGFSDEGYVLPELRENTVILDINELSDDPASEGLFRKIETNATAYHKEKRYTAEKRAIQCAEIATSADQHVIWCNTDYEADLLKKYIPDAVEVRGSHKTEYKEDAALNFIDGNIKILISKPKIFGYGLNFQNCNNTVFCGTDYSWENYYQAVRRFYRFGQKKPVNVHTVIGSTEKQILDVVHKKAKLQDEMKSAMYGSIKAIQNANIRGTEFKLNLNTPKITVPEWLKGGQ